jgi:hypothetical protein
LSTLRAKSANARLSGFENLEGAKRRTHRQIALVVPATHAPPGHGVKGAPTQPVSGHAQVVMRELTQQNS